MRTAFIICLICLLTTDVIYGQRRRLAEEALANGKELWSVHDCKSALPFLNEAIRQDPLLREAYKLRAECRTAVGENEGALFDYTVYLEWYPTDREALFSFSDLNYKQKHYQLALDGFLKLKTLPGGETSRIYYRQREGSEGTTGIFTAQSKDKSFIDNYIGLIFREMGDFSRSLAYFDSALNVQPQNPDYISNKGVTYLAINDRKAAESMFTRALEIEPGHPVASNVLADMIAEDGDTKKAVSFYSEAINNNPSSPNAYQHRGYAHLLSGENQAAIADFDAAIEKNPKEATTWMNRGIALMRMGILEEAFSDLSKAIELQPNFSGAYLNRGNVLYKMGDYKAALNDYDVALLYQKNYPLAQYHRGITLYQLGDKESGCNALKFAAVNDVKVAGETYKRICQE